MTLEDFMDALIPDAWLLGKELSNMTAGELVFLLLLVMGVFYIVFER